VVVARADRHRVDCASTRHSPLDRRHSPEPGQHGVQGSARVLTARPICQQSSGKAFKRVQPLRRSGYPRRLSTATQPSASKPPTIHTRGYGMRGWAICKTYDQYKPGRIYPAPAIDGIATFDTGQQRAILTISDAVQIAEGIDRRITQQVAIARHRGASWEQISRCLGISRQAAWARYNRDCKIAKPGKSRFSGRCILDAVKPLQCFALRRCDIQKILERLVAEARTAGRSWEDIASELGVRRQTAWERYGQGNL